MSNATADDATTPAEQGVAARTTNGRGTRITTVRRAFPVAASVLLAVFACWAAGVLDASRPLRFGHDLLTPYTVGRMVLSGDGGRLYDAAAVESAGRQVLTAANVFGDPRQIHWLNPGWFAAPFVPLALLPYRWALVVWTAVNAGLFAWTLSTLLSWLPDRRRTRLVFAAAVLTSCPFLLAFGHQQNTFLSLALIVAVMSACQTTAQAGDLFRAGVLAGLLAYKPQLAVGVGLVLAIVGGRRAVAGLVVGGLAMLVLGELVAPGSTAAFVRAVPSAVAAVQAEPGYNWGRQVTPTAFWRTIAGPGGARWVTAAAAATTLAVLATLAATAWRHRRAAEPADVLGRADVAGQADVVRLPDLVGLAVLALPLSAPYFMDYDLLLLVAPAAVALGAAHRRRSARPARQVAGVVGWAALWLAAYANVDAVASVGVNVVPLVTVALFATAVRSVWQAERPATGKRI